MKPPSTSNTATNLVALATLLFLWGVGARLDAADSPATDPPADLSASTSVAMDTDKTLVRLVCMAESDLQSGQPQPRNQERVHLTSYTVKPPGEAQAITPVLRCFVDND